MSCAVVVGGGIGGLLAAHALGASFDRVVVVERDHDPAGAGPRRGVPQARCLHMLMAGGLAAFERVVPGWRADLLAAGALPFDFGEHAALRFPDGWLPRFTADIPMFACSRGLLEACLRRRLGDVPHVTLAPGRTVVGLCAGATGSRVTGVRTGGAGIHETVLDADLVVIAGGRGVPLGSWLTALGVPAPDETVVEAPFHYTSRWFEIPPSFGDDWKLLSIAPAGPVNRSGLVFEAEGRRWGVALLAPREEPAPATGEAFLDLAARLADARLHDAIAGARPASAVFRYGPSKNRILHCERAARWPDGLVALGDAVCELDPYFGLGMTACARGVGALADHLHEGLATPGEAGAARRFQEQLARTNAAPWRIAAGPAPDAQEAFYLRSLHRLALDSPALCRVLFERMHLLSPPDVLARADVVSLVRTELDRRRGARDRAPDARSPRKDDPS